MKQLTGLDAAFLAMETATSFGHISSVCVYERPGDPDFHPYEMMKRRLEARLDRLEPFRRKLVEVPLGLDFPYWVEDPDFDLEYHLRHIAIPPPGDDRQLADQVARIIGRPCDRSRPLWELYVMEGLEGGRFAVLTKVHHATVDGAAGAELLTMLLDRDDDEDEGPATLPTPSPPPSPLGLLGLTAVHAVRRPVVGLRANVHLAREVATALGWHSAADAAAAVGRNLPGPLGAVARCLPGVGPGGDEHVAILPTGGAPATPFNGTITAHRRVVLRTVSLARVKAIKDRLGVTVNDVVVAACAGGLRRYLEHHDALPETPLVTMIPVSVRTGDEEDPWTNRVSAVFPTLPTHLADPADRLAEVHATMARLKDELSLLPAERIVELAELAPPALAHAAARLAATAHLGDRIRQPVNVVISNVPGPRTPLTCGGARLLHYYPVSTIIEGQGLNITVQSYVDELDLGLVAARNLVPDLELVADLVVAEVDVLEELAPAT